MSDSLRELLRDSGVLTAEWEKPFEAAPRRLFLPEVMWPSVEGENIVVSKADDPEEWRRWADTDVPIVTQWDDGDHTGPERGTLATSSSSMPSLVFDMFADLSVEDGMRVLEVGTGTGWCAALLSARLGEENVVSVEVDAAVAEAARKALAIAGWHPEVVTGDGLLGHPGRAPYDRMLVTAGVRKVPRAWIEQTRPGGVIVLPWETPYSRHNAVVRLVVGDDGTASGRFRNRTQFMMLRSQRGEWIRYGDYIPGDSWPDDTRRSTTGLPAGEVLGEEYTVFAFVAGLLVPECVHTHGRSPQGTPTLWLYGLGDRSWAAVFFDEDAQVFQGGPRDLWGEVEAAHRWWTERGRPGHTEFGLTVTADGHQKAWLGDPSEPVPRAASAVR
ncbi:protein-L-isoaspartate(D-aspartate) O-methyltransferase [Streptosporangium saharense]|uniref:protein-L-isoaspartate(D-aspartate) O-methyltransferase n=1 Tax=Streptosporangium saharense TaxID=1706840 RepID=UPI003445200B